jgi:hypothetical protein
VLHPLNLLINGYCRDSRKFCKSCCRTDYTMAIAHLEEVPNIHKQAQNKAQDVKVITPLLLVFGEQKSKIGRFCWKIRSSDEAL